MTIEEFKTEIEKLGLTVTDEMLEKLEIIYNELITVNKTMNLTRIVNKKDIYLKHFYDSLTIAKIYDLSKVSTLCDIGSGAGFPGLILKIFYPNLQITLIDALLKRVNYLNNLIKKLDLSNIKAYHIRAEDLQRENKRFDVVTARAVAHLPKLLTWAMPLVNKEGCFIAMKGDVTNELVEARKIMSQNNYKIIKQKIFSLPYNQGKRTLLIIKKEQ